MPPKMQYEAVIGLEVHVQIKTRSKMYTRVEMEYGREPNTLTDPVVLGFPGVLPVMNKVGLDLIIKTGLMLGCKIADQCKWDRKNYFYPDSTKNYQISQYDQPICEGGSVEIELPGKSRKIMGEHKKIALTRIHLEEDLGKLTHHSSDSSIDFNRAGASLMEIVSEPDMESADEAFGFLTSLRQSMIYAGVSDCDMEKGQMRCDANISIRPVGEVQLGTKVELKNLNSISGVRNGIDYEIRRQIQLTNDGEPIVQETRRWDADSGMSVSMRSKEMAHDYRYFPDPDLMPVQVDEEWREKLRGELPETPFDKQRRFMADYDLPYTITAVLVPDRMLSEYFEKAVSANPKKAQAIGNWITNDLLREMSDCGKSLEECLISPKQIYGLVEQVESGAISSNIAKEVFAEMFRTGESAEAIVDRKGLKQSTDVGELEQWCKDAIEANPGSVADFKSGNEKAINALKGKVMKESKGKANPRIVDEVMRRLLETV